MKLETKAKRISAVISLDGYDDPDAIFSIKGKILDWLHEEKATRFAYILHDADNRDDGTPKLPHIHIYAEFPCSGRRLGTYLNLMAGSLGINPFAISIERANDPEEVIKYLIHKNAPEKYQYSADEVITNIPKDEFDMIINSESVAFTVDYVIDTWKTCGGVMRDFIRIIGIERYRMYRPVIYDILGLRRH